MKISCCKDCPDRHLACHDSCRKYSEYKHELKVQRIYLKTNNTIGRISKNDFDKEFWMERKLNNGGKK